MAERELGEPPEGVDSSAFLDDLNSLSNNDLRKAYPREASSHRNRRAHAKAQGWEFDPAWDEFRSFLRDMGPMPPGPYTLDRVDGNVLGYGPGLCRWADKALQTKNRRNTRYVSYGGEDLTLAEFSDRIGKPYKTVHSALARGVSPEQIASEGADAGIGTYCPLRYRHDPDGSSQWYGKFLAWKKNVRRKHHSTYARAEIFDIVAVAKLYPIAEAWLKSRGYFELTVEEGKRAERLVQSELGRIYVNAVSWIDHALTQLEMSDPRLAHKLRASPNRYHVFADLYDDLLRAPEG